MKSFLAVAIFSSPAVVDVRAADYDAQFNPMV